MKRKGMKSLPPKERREVRRRNHIALDLRTPKYRQRVVDKKRRSFEDVPFTEWDED